MRFLLLIGLLLLLAPAARAQDSLVVARPAALAPAAAPTSTDTLAALHRLFAYKRSVRTGVVGGTVLVSGLVIGISASNISSSSSRDYDQLGVIALGVVTVPIVLAELLYFGSNYSRRRERLAIQDFQAHRLSASLRQKLGARYFQPTAP